MITTSVSNPNAFTTLSNIKFKVGSYFQTQLDEQISVKSVFLFNLNNFNSEFIDKLVIFLFPFSTTQK